MQSLSFVTGIPKEAGVLVGGAMIAILSATPTEVLPHSSTIFDRKPVQADLKTPLGPYTVSVEAGSYTTPDQLQQAIAIYNMVTQKLSVPQKPPLSWLTSASDTLGEVMSEAQADDAVIPATPVMQKAKAVLTLCANHPIAEPAIAHDDKGGIEIFFKKNARAVMVAVQADGFMTIYGDDPDEQWRGRYKASGAAWRRHLSSFVAEVASA